MKPPATAMDSHSTPNGEGAQTENHNQLERKGLRIGGRYIRPELARRLFDEACALSEAYTGREISAQLVKRYPSLTEPLVDYLIVRWAMTLQRRAENLRVGVLNAVAMADEADIETWNEAA